MKTTEVDVFIADIHDHDCDEMVEQLGRDCMERLARITHPRRREQFILGRSLLRHALLHKHGAVAEGWILDAASGKPCLVGVGAPEISLSHSRELVACAIAPVAVGLDVEYCRERDFVALAEQICGPEEFHHFLSLPMSERSDGFYRIWTLKEAIFKLYGRPMPLAFHASGLRSRYFWPGVDFLAALVARTDCTLCLKLHSPSSVRLK
ncbi:MAG: 4'-phosphopantetheinyl transferase superfamily protein [Pseudomonadota bacterium]|nr:4'-phosphopantetheinyl transferase superfamily protein [Pseudomonadota bacterium]